MFFKLPNDRPTLFQWDTNQKITITDPALCEGKVHFAKIYGDKAYCCNIEQTENGEFQAPIPDILLQTEGDLRAYAYISDHVGAWGVIKVQKRPKPEDYVYTEDEKKNLIS